MRMTIRIAIAALSVLSASATAGESVTYTGTGTYTVTRSLLPLANGGAALHLVNNTVAAVEPSESGFMHGTCAGLGYLSVEGEATVKSVCNFEFSSADAFVVMLDGDPKTGAAVKVMGGRGKFDGAGGTGKIRQTFLEGDRGSYEFEFKITTP